MSCSPKAPGCLGRCLVWVSLDFLQVCCSRKVCSAAALMYNSQTLNWEMLKAYYVSGLPMDLIHAAATVIFILIAAEPMLEKLDRIKVKYGLVE